MTDLLARMQALHSPDAPIMRADPLDGLDESDLDASDSDDAEPDSDPRCFSDADLSRAARMAGPRAWSRMGEP